MNNTSKAKLTSAEIAALWTQYMNETASICIHKHMLEHIEDTEIRSVFEYAMALSHEHTRKIKEFFKSESFPIPIGFSENDYIPNVPRVFSDVFCLNYLNIMSIHGCNGYSGAITTCTRVDVRNYFSECITTSVELCNQTKNLLLEKGLYLRPPVITPPDRAEYIDDKSYLTGWLGEKRPLSCIEIADIYFNLKKSIFAKAFVVFAHQVAKSKDVKKLLKKAVKTKEKHVRTFFEVFLAENLPNPSIFDAEITDSTNSPFSEKLIMFQVGFLFSTAMVYYGTGWATSPRRDLSPKYMKAIADDLDIGNEWINLMIKNRWIEQSPLSEDRSKLAEQKNE
ncbi:DUF3231 family protein [Cytobacillus kochii]|uniref:DUF3231 family protein n=1 Tax=Cytobacillus kochii TaxID=859143 RepID=UPI001CD438E2|nr:DUF3231 family protein [Cytobacillus kochii]MCA1028974.1 DUF3231 family protein [Cytobacillus kochii]